MLTPAVFFQEKRDEIEKGAEINVREQAVYTRCWCEADNCIGRLFS